MADTQPATRPPAPLGKVILLTFLGGALVFAAVTLLALEGKEVVVVHTQAADGSARRTRTWIADDQGIAHIEVANPEREFLHDIQRGSPVKLERDGNARSVRASVLPQPGGHQRIRQMLREKYGWADRWVAMLTDTSRSLAVRFDDE